MSKIRPYSYRVLWQNKDCASSWHGAANADTQNCAPKKGRSRGGLYLRKSGFAFPNGVRFLRSSNGGRDRSSDSDAERDSFARMPAADSAPASTKTASLCPCDLCALARRCQAPIAVAARLVMLWHNAIPATRLLWWPDSDGRPILRRLGLNGPQSHARTCRRVTSAVAND
jgi:hypothetical protein